MRAVDDEKYFFAQKFRWKIGLRFEDATGSDVKLVWDYEDLKFEILLKNFFRDKITDNNAQIRKLQIHLTIFDF